MRYRGAVDFLTMRPIWCVRCVPSTVKGKIQTSPPSFLAFLRSFPQPHARFAIDELDVRPFKRSAHGGKIVFARHSPACLEFFDHFAGNDRDAGKLSPGDVGQRPSCSALNWRHLGSFALTTAFACTQGYLPCRAKLA